jgi:hypothetical protein
MTYLEVAIDILKNARRPMSADDITHAALHEGHRPKGRTPEATMSSTLYVYLSDAEDPLPQREFIPGRTRAARRSVRWLYVG